MKHLILNAVLLLQICTLYAATTNITEKQRMRTTILADTVVCRSGYANVNGLKMYYEVYLPPARANKTDMPLVMLHGGGSTIQTSFGCVIPLFSKSRKLICVELQAHGRTGDRNAPISFEQDADDVAMLLSILNIGQADVFGFSNGGNTALQMAIRHPKLCNKIVAGSVLLKRNGAMSGFWNFMQHASFEQMPQPYKDAFMKVNPDSIKLKTLYVKCARRMQIFNDFTDDQLSTIQSPVLLINGDRDVGTSEHIVAMSRLIPHCRLAIVPGGHGEYIGEITTLQPGCNENEFAVPLIEKFLDEKAKL